ncbi:MAG TPA: glycosyltransferase, partial [Solirubrobacteraceae bacterium]|nr:glycosyltransferase [Solirubrobacteraceae bacterium]
RAQPAPASTPAAALDAAQARAQPAPVPAPTAARDAAKREGEGDAAEREGEGGAAEREGEGGAFARDADAVAGALARLGEEGEQLVAYVGKLIVSKGVDLLLAAWPLVLARVPRARLAIVGFGAYRVGLESLCAALAAGDLAGARELALAGRAIEDASSARRPLAHLLAFLDALEGDERERYLAAARALSERVVFCGRLEHDELAELLPACDALVVPSTFPEAFGMVAAEAAACGALPVSAAHSGLAEVSAALAQAVPAPAARWLSFALGEDAVLALAGNVAGWLLAERALRERTRGALVATVRRRWSWEGVAQTVIAAAHGELDALPSP